MSLYTADGLTRKVSNAWTTQEQPWNIVNTLRNVWNLHLVLNEQQMYQVTDYSLLKSSTVHFLRTSNEGVCAGYPVVYHRCTRGSLATAKECLLSFRRYVHPMTGAVSKYVLVKPYLINDSE